MAEIVIISRPTLTWPTGVPGKPLRDGYTGNTPFQGIRSETDSGVDRVRATPTIPRKLWSLTYIMLREELTLLQSFANIATGKYFLWPHPLGDQVLLVARFKDDGTNLFQDTALGGGYFSVPVNMETQQNVTFEYTDGPWPWR